MLGTGRADAQFLDVSLADVFFFIFVDQQFAVDKLRKVRQRDIFAHGHAENQALCFAILGDECKTRCNAIARSAQVQHVTLNADFAVLRNIRARDVAHDIRASRPD